MSRIRIEAGDVAVAADGSVKITNTSLLNGLVRNQEGTLQILTDNLAKVSLDNLEIDDFGRIIVKHNDAFKAAIEKMARVGGSSSGNNCNC